MPTPLTILVKTPWRTGENDRVPLNGDVPIEVGAVIDLDTGLAVAATVAAYLIGEDGVAVASDTLDRGSDGVYRGCFTDLTLTEGAIYTIRISATYGDGSAVQDWAVIAA